VLAVRTNVLEELTTTLALLSLFNVSKLFEKPDDAQSLAFSTRAVTPPTAFTHGLR